MRAEFNAFKAELAVPSVLNNRVFTAVRVTDAGELVRDNYAVTIPYLPELDDKRYTAPQTANSAELCEFDVRFVGTTADAVLLLLDAALEHMLFRVLTIPGRVCDPIRVDRTANDRAGMQFDKSARLFYIDATFVFTSRSA
uniref:hypothetical protein n=1 Tax=Microbacterium proteolyticum TaxID=1572644 RepID=UPI002416786A|nr:hypothetical protein [Microbacterium proteolyticum]